jgi:hypothetical protein
MQNKRLTQAQGWGYYRQKQTTKDENMKREEFLITSTEGHSITKHAWNSANREVERLVGEIANSEGRNYRLIDSKSEKEGFYHVSGIRVWGTGVTLHDAKEISFFITKIA